MATKHIESLLFTEKYRPKTIQDMILPERLKNRFENGIGELNRILLYSDSPGTGKSSLAKVLVSQFGHLSLYINASRDSSVDIIRDEITDFCANRTSITSGNVIKSKIVILDEIDGASAQLFKSFKGFRKIGINRISLGLAYEDFMDYRDLYFNLNFLL